MSVIARVPKSDYRSPKVEIMVILDTMESIGNLEEQALKRKERLKNLKRKAPNSDDTVESTSKAEPVVLPKPKFRSYKPQDESLQKEKLEDAEPSLVEEEVKDLVEAGKEKVVLQDLDISSLAPRKPDWDLKRDVAKKLEKLERRTQKAIAELIWERLKEGNEENLSAMVSLNENRPADED
ncbi:unnamed protein product, partial [Brenthis ino]